MGRSAALYNRRCLSARENKAGVKSNIETQGIKLKQNHIVMILVGACLALFYLALFISGSARPVISQLVAKESIEYWLYDAPGEVVGNISLKYRDELDALYRKNQFQTIWMDHFQLTPAAKDLVKSLQHTASDEWKAYGYRISKLQTEISRLSNQPKHAAAIDILLSDAYIDYAQQVLNNELLPNTGELDHPSFKKVAAPPATRITSLDVISLLSQSLDQGKLHSLVKGLVPQQPGYQNLANELDRYQSIADSGLWYPLNVTTGLTLGDTHAQLPRLRWMLKAYGDYQQSKLTWLLPKKDQENPLLLEQDFRRGSDKPAYLFDQDVFAALKHYQNRNGLNQSGILTSETISQLNEAPYFIAQRIALNMKRWRYLPKDLGDRYILVNLANFHLDLIKKGKSELSMKVVIGRNQRRTPVLAETISSVVLAPAWNVPHRIAVRDILPVAQRNPQYLQNNHYRIFEGWQESAAEIGLENINWEGFNNRINTYRMLQAPGKNNALGDVKFVFPNDKSIYLHDTNHKELFGRKMRALSSGCIRVEKPRELAHALLKEQNWDKALISNVIDKSKTRPVQLKNPIPVYLMYWTTWVDSSGQLQVRDDIYKRDQIHGESHKLDSIIL
ncbi:MAG: L,D-transpeptidase family protein [Bermanella sp.]